MALSRVSVSTRTRGEDKEPIITGMKIRTNMAEDYIPFDAAQVDALTACVVKSEVDASPMSDLQVGKPASGFCSSSNTRSQTHETEALSDNDHILRHIAQLHALMTEVIANQPDADMLARQEQEHLHNTSELRTNAERSLSNVQRLVETQQRLCEHIGRQDAQHAQKCEELQQEKTQLIDLVHRWADSFRQMRSQSEEMVADREKENADLKRKIGEKDTIINCFRAYLEAYGLRFPYNIAESVPRRP